jgi:antirestriction protein
MATNNPTNSDDVIDSRDIIARIEELEGERDDYEPGDSAPTWADKCPDDAAELATLKALAEECASVCGDWEHGEALIRDSYFQEYAQQLADDCGLIDSTAKWPMSCIDWEQAARELQMDYSTVDFDGVTYWTR